MKYLFFLPLVIVLGCSTPKDPKEKAVDITPSVKSVALKQGNRISSLAQQALGSQLMKKINIQGPEAAVEFCNLAAYPILDSLKTGMEVKIKRASLKMRNVNNTPDPVEEKIIRSYQEQLSKKEDLEPVVQVLSKSELLYAAPIQTKNKMCLSCHGMGNDEINESTLSRINTLYPDDKAKGHRVGDLRGIWSITFQKDELLKYKTDEEAINLDNGLALIQQNCYSCHSPNSASHDDIIAPPLAGVKRRYLRAADGDKATFVAQMSAFLLDPTEESALMQGPVNRFGLMPKFNWSKEMITKMVEYLYENELEAPAWFEKHHREMHPE